MNLGKRHFAKRATEWLGHKYTSTGLTPLYTKAEASRVIKLSGNLKKFRSFMERSTMSENSYRNYHNYATHQDLLKEKAKID